VTPFHRQVATSAAEKKKRDDPAGAEKLKSRLCPNLTTGSDTAALKFIDRIRRSGDSARMCVRQT